MLSVHPAVLIGLRELEVPKLPLQRLAERVEPSEVQEVRGRLRAVLDVLQRHRHLATINTESACKKGDGLPSHASAFHITRKTPPCPRL